MLDKKFDRILAKFLDSGKSRKHTHTHDLYTNFSDFYGSL